MATRNAHATPGEALPSHKMAFYEAHYSFELAEELMAILRDMLPDDSPERRLVEHIAYQHIGPGLDELSQAMQVPR